MNHSSLPPDTAPFQTGATAPAQHDAGLKKDDEVVVPVIQERLEVRREVVETGGAVRVRKIVHQEYQDVDTTTMQDEVSVERIAMNRLVDAPFEPRHEGATLIVPVFEEVAVVEKRLMLKEEVRITLIRKQTASTQRVTLEHEEAIVERRDAQTGEWHPDPSAVASTSPLPHKAPG